MSHRETHSADSVRDDLAELTLLWPALADALERDAGTVTDERVNGTTNVHTIPVNPEVLRTVTSLLREVPDTARWATSAVAEPHNPARDVLAHLRHFQRLYDRLSGLNQGADAGHLARTISGWLDQTKTAVGLKIRDRRLGQFCPVHDEPLAELVTPGDEGWIEDSAATGGNTIRWRRDDVVLCRHCGTTWAPSRFLFLGRMLVEADDRRVQSAA